MEDLTLFVLFALFACSDRAKGADGDIAQIRIRYGYRLIHVLLHREGWSAGKEQVYRLYQLEGLQLRSKRPKRRKVAVTRRERVLPRMPGEAWSMDFVSDQLANGQRFRALTVIDVFTREALMIEVGMRLRGHNVAAVCNRLVACNGAPKRIFVDNGSEFSGQLMDLWAYHHKVQIDFSRPEKPTDNCFIESFNGRLRDECLNANWFNSIDDATATIEAWRRDYNESRPHQSLNELTPAAFARKTREIDAATESTTAGD
jgi:putative transposase